MRKKGTRISPEITAKAVKLLNSGMSQIKVSEELRISHGTVNAISQERVRILAEAAAGHIVKATPVQGEMLNTKQWLQRRSNYTETVRAVLNGEELKTEVVKTEKSTDFAQKMAKARAAKKANSTPIQKVSDNITTNKTQESVKSEMLTINYNGLSIHIDQNTVSDVFLSQGEVKITTK